MRGVGERQSLFLVTVAAATTTAILLVKATFAVRGERAHTSTAAEVSTAQVSG